MSLSFYVSSRRVHFEISPVFCSPNIQCAPSGPGRGRGGQPGMPGENCIEQGNVLVVQESSVETVPEAR